jgi:hypothetical protein
LRAKWPLPTATTVQLSTQIRSFGMVGLAAKVIDQIMSAGVGSPPFGFDVTAIDTCCFASDVNETAFCDKDEGPVRVIHDFIGLPSHVRYSPEADLRQQGRSRGVTCYSAHSCRTDGARNSVHDVINGE